MQTITIRRRAEKITLGQFLKVAGVAHTGGEGKGLIQAGRVLVNGEPEKRRGRRLSDGDRVLLAGGNDGDVFLVAYD